MISTLVVAVAIVAATSFVAFAEAADPGDAPQNPTVEETQKLVQAITSFGSFPFASARSALMCPSA
jgi:hypothetical protein